MHQATMRRANAKISIVLASFSPGSLLRIAAVAAGVVLAGCTEEKSEGSRGVPGGAGSGTVTSGGDGDGDGDGAPSCDDLPGPFGTHPNETLDPGYVWGGFEAGETELGSLALADYALCSGDADTTAIVIQVDALWCPACRDVAEGLAERNATKWAPQGVKGISLVVEDEDGAPADEEDAFRWRQQFDLDDLAVGFDPDYSLRNEDPDALPQAIIVDPRTMRIVARVYGNKGIQPIIDELVRSNQ